MVISNKMLWILSGIIGTVFLIIVISLAIAGKIKTTALIIFIIIIVLLVFIIDMTFWFIRKSKKIKIEVDGVKTKVINLPTAREIFKQMILSEQYSEYEKEQILEDVWNMGESNTPVYVKLIKGEFDGNLLGGVINLENSEKRGIKEYKEVEITRDNIFTDLERRANLVAISPKSMPSREEEVIERPGGEVVRRSRIITKDEHIDKKLEGGLK